MCSTAGTWRSRYSVRHSPHPSVPIASSAKSSSPPGCSIRTSSRSLIRATPGGELDFAEEAIGTDGCGECRTEYLERHVPAVLHIAREIDRRHAATSQLPLDYVAVGEGGLQLCGRGDGRHVR